MKKNSIKCPRCGKEYDITIQQAFEGIRCPHCNRKMVLDAKSKKRLKYVRYILVLVISVLVMLAVKNLLADSDILSIIIVVGLALVMVAFAQVADRACGYIVFYLFGFTYEEKIETDKKEKGKK